MDLDGAKAIEVCLLPLEQMLRPKDERRPVSDRKFSICKFFCVKKILKVICLAF